MRTYALTVATLALSPPCQGQFANIADDRFISGEIYFLDRSSNEQFDASDMHVPPGPGPWQDSVNVPLSIAIGSGTAAAQINAEALTSMRIAGSASASLSLTAGNTNMYASGNATSRIETVFDLLQPTRLHVEADLNGEGAEVWIYDPNSAYYPYQEAGENNFQRHLSDTFVLGPGHWTYNASAVANGTFNDQTGTTTPSASGTFALTIFPLCYANCDNSTTPPILNVLDFGCFLNKFAAGDPYANCDGSTTPPVLNVLDFGCFLNRFAAGCS